MKTNEIIKALRCCGDDNCVECPLYDGFPDSAGCHGGIAQTAADEIEKLTDRCTRYAEEIAVLQEKEKWISTTERLPEAGETVLAVVYGKPNENVELIGAIELAEWYEGEWFIDAWPDWENVRVTHWLPLPAGPEVERWND